MITKRFELLKPYIKGKRVLDLGFGDFRWEWTLRDSWIHRSILEHAKELIGLDIAEDVVKKLAKVGYNARCANVENFDLNTKFDVIFAGELIEHLENFAGFLESCKKHMKHDSYLIDLLRNYYFRG